MKKTLFAFMLLASTCFAQYPTCDINNPYCNSPQTRQQYIQDKGRSYGEVGGAVGAAAATGYNMLDAATGNVGDKMQAVERARQDAYDGTIKGYETGKKVGEWKARRDIEENCD